MTADHRWQQAQEIFGRASPLPDEARTRFLDEACAGDGDLRAEVESLLAHQSAATAEFLEPPRTRAAAPPP